MFPTAPDASTIQGKTLTATGTLVTVPAGHWFTGNWVLSASVTVAGTSQPRISVNGTGSAPASGSVLAQINVVGLALTNVTDSASGELLVYADTSDITIDFTAGASGTSSGSINGYYF